MSALKNGFRDEYLVGFGDRLGPGGGVYNGADRRQVPVRVAELAKTQFTGVNADADPQLACGKAVFFDQGLAPVAPL